MSDDEYDSDTQDHSETMHSEEDLAEETEEEISDEEVSEDESEEESEDESEEDLAEQSDADEEESEVETEEESDEEEDSEVETEENSSESEEEDSEENKARLQELKSRIEERLKKTKGKETMYDLLEKHLSNVDKNRFFFGKSIHKVVNRLFEMECLPLYHSADEDLQDICLEYDDYGIELCKSMESSSFAEEHIKMVREKIERINAMYDDIFSDLMELQPIFNDLL